MRSSSDYLERLRSMGGVATGVNFDLIVAFDFYDGPESGFAFYATGEALRFWVMGESKSPLVRAFEFALLRGSWPEKIKTVIDSCPPSSHVGTTIELLSGPASGGRMLFFKESDQEISTLVHSVSAIEEKARYVGIGGAYLDPLIMAAVPSSDSEKIAIMARSGDYEAVSHYIKYAQENRP